MPVRNYRSRGSRGPNRRTRWLAIVPGSYALLSDSIHQQEVIIRDLEGNVQFNDFVGGTLLKVYLTVEVDPTIILPATTAEGFSTDHFGIYLTEDASPSTGSGTAWDPNIPFGDFMTRWSSSYRVHIGSTDDHLSESWSNTAELGGGQQALAVTNVKRRIRENDRLWFATAHFEDGAVVTQTAYGYSGRVLIALP